MSFPLPQFDPRRAMPVPDLGEPAHSVAHLTDSHGRKIHDLRLSLTDRCNFRCVYCMDPDVRFRRRADLMTDTEMLRLVRVFQSLGVNRVRLTGGEPTLHPTLTGLIEGLTSLGVSDLAMTTNGSIATEASLAAWRDAGLKRLNVSLDSLRPDRLESLARTRINPATVVETIRLALRVGLTPVKVNTVVMRGRNDDEIADFADLARELGVELRFIEFMPLDSGRRWGRDHVFPADEILERVEARHPLIGLDRERPSSPAQSFGFADGAPGGVGVIASVTRPFCGACSRTRVTADGKLVPCLFSTSELDLLALMRAGASDDELSRAIISATLAKQAGHGIASVNYRQPSRPMSAIGG